MPWWLIVYLGGFAVFTAFWVRDALRDGDSKSLVVVELVSDACMVVVALGFWLAPMRALLGSHSRVVFVAGLAWLVLAAVRDLGATLPDSEMTTRENMATALVALTMYAVVCGPLLYWGFQFSVLGNTNGN